MTNENREHCKRIALELEAYIKGDLYRCPECGEVIEWKNEQHNPVTGEFVCQACGRTVDDGELEAVSLYDFFADALDIEYRVGSDKKYRSVRIMVAYGGPNIYIDTQRKAVELYWWTDYESFPLSLDAVEAVDEWAEQFWSC